jgi:hypothetical protein
MRITKSKLALTGTAAAVVALAGTAAYGFFTTTGSGGGSASVGSAAQWQVNVSGVSGPALLPGVGAQTFTYQVINNGASAQQLSSVTAAFNVDSNGDINGAPGCSASWFTINIAGQPAGLVAANGGTNSGTGTITMADSGTVQNACENVTPAFTLSAS